jgi:hypothetical protein
MLKIWKLYKISELRFTILASMNKELNRMTSIGVRPLTYGCFNLQGTIAWKDSRAEESISWFDKILEINPKDILALTLKGTSSQRACKKIEAFTWIDKSTSNRSL